MYKIFGFALLPLLPMIIESTYYALSKDPLWSMTWGNEVRAWGAILAPFALVGVFFAYKHAYKWIIAFPVFTFLVALLNPIVFGLEAESNLYSSDLELLDFWTEQWQSWAPLLDHLTSQD